MNQKSDRNHQIDSYHRHIELIWQARRTGRIETLVSFHAVVNQRQSAHQLTASFPIDGGLLWWLPPLRQTNVNSSPWYSTTWSHYLARRESIGELLNKAICHPWAEPAAMNLSSGAVGRKLKSDSRKFKTEGRAFMSDAHISIAFDVRRARIAQGSRTCETGRWRVRSAMENHAANIIAQRWTVKRFFSGAWNISSALCQRRLHTVLL